MYISPRASKSGGLICKAPHWPRSFPLLRLPHTRAYGGGGGGVGVGVGASCRVHIKYIQHLPSTPYLPTCAVPGSNAGEEKRLINLGSEHSKHGRFPSPFDGE
jgi:hypothetical protein